MKKFRDTYLDTSKHLSILDVGSSEVNGTYASLFKHEKWTYHGADIHQGKNVDILLDNPYKWDQIKSNSYDVVISGQAYEHIEYFWITTLQINRVLKVGGISCIIAPSSGQEHRYPTDCWRFYPDGLQTIAKWGKMEVIEATTQWQNEKYEDGSDEWKDSMLVCMKLAETPELESVLEMMHSWVGLQNPKIESMKKNLTTIRDLPTAIQQNFVEIQLDKILENKKVFPSWYEAVSYLMLVYSERPDLRAEFPKVESNGEFLELFCWAKEFGVLEDPRLAPYTDFYKKYCHKI